MSRDSGAAAPEPGARAGALDRVLALAGDAEPGLGSGKLHAFRCFVLLHAAVRSCLWLLLSDALPGAGLALTAFWLSALAVLSVRGPMAWLAPRLALPALLLQLASTFPLTDNHFFLELYCVAFLCVVGRSGDGEALALPALRLLAALVLFHAGLQKALHGEYFRGDFLAFMVGQGDRFADLFRLALPDAEVARLAAYDPLREGAGPYRVGGVGGLAFALLSNAIWSAEIALGALLCVRRTRGAAALAAIALVLVIQLGARELGFGLLFANLLLLAAPGNANARLLPVFAALYLYALAAALGIVPGGGLIDPGYL